MKIARLKSRKKIVFASIIASVVLLSGGLLLTKTQKPADASLAGWNAANIMSDYTMTNKNTMSEAQIQSFLKSKNHCNNRDIHMAGWYPNVSYNIRDGHFVCMADDTFNGETAAHIIWQTAQDYSINPQVLIVLLEKEQGLVTDTWPNSVQYRSATGYGCPDTAACDSQYYGLKNQVRNAARFFRAYQDDNPGWYKPYWVGGHNIYWNPDHGCGTSWIDIANRATASLYSYTPYRPNQAALNAGYGMGDYCSSYGNRNFYNLFTDWFGSTQSYELRGAIGEYWFKTNGSIGTPLSDEICGLVRGGCYQSFSGGVIIWSEETGAWESHGGIRERWGKTNFESGYLGYPIGPEHWDGRGWWQAYENGVIIGTATTGFWESKGAIRERWLKTGSQAGYLGYPTSSEICGLKDGGCYQMYENNKIIIWSTKSGAWEVLGGIRDYWRKIGSENGKLGYPTGPEYTTAGGGWYQAYQNGIIIGTSRTGFWESMGKIRERWAATRFENGDFGYPTGAVICGLIRGGCYQSYENAVVLYSPNSNTWETRGGIRNYWAKLGFESGRTGYPTGPETFDAKAGVGGVWAQTYENGIMRYSEARGGWFTAK